MKIKEWFNTHHNQINIYKHYPNRKRISKITWRLTWISLIIFLLYSMLLSSIYPSDPDSTTNFLDKISPQEFLIYNIMILIVIVLIIIFVFTNFYNKDINRFPLKSTTPLSDDQKNDVINSLDKLLKDK